MKNNPKRIAVGIVVLLLSAINYQSDLFKFLFTGLSATYDVTVIRHSSALVIILAVLIIFLLAVMRVKADTRLRYLFTGVTVLWLLSMRTVAYISSEETLISGWSFIRIHATKCSVAADAAQTKCTISMDPILNKKLEEVQEK